jgi:hypothetical protein
MAERWARLAERYETEPTTTPKPVSRRRRDPIQRQRAAGGSSAKKRCVGYAGTEKVREQVTPCLLTVRTRAPIC